MSRVRAALLATAVLGACACVPARAAREPAEAAAPARLLATADSLVARRR